MKLNDFTNLHLNQIALSSDHAGELQFEVPVDEQTHQQLTGWAATQVLQGRGPVVRVPAMTLDDYAASQGIGHIRLVKLDLEGGEFEAIKGMRRLLSTHAIDYLITESNTWLLEHRHMSGQAVIEGLTGQGYRLYGISSTFWGGPSIQDPKGQKLEVEEFLYTAPGLEPPHR